MLVACDVIQSTRAGSLVVCSRCEEGAARTQLAQIHTVTNVHAPELLK